MNAKFSYPNNSNFDTLDPSVHCIKEWASVVLPNVAIFRVVEQCCVVFSLEFCLGWWTRSYETVKSTAG